MDSMLAVWRMSHSIFVRAVVSHNETNDLAEAAMTLPLLARAMHPGTHRPLSMDHRDLPVDTSRQWMLLS